uniref:Reverse transcriptase domain-containing protein n=1 Tax=Triticum urartu TaxID=4572 RepID=A0A8R7PBK5_TRIUA
MDEVLHHVPCMVTDEMNGRLDRPFCADEVEKALFAMAPAKAPGADGFHAGFYQHHWSLIKEDVTRSVLNFLNGRHMPEAINKTVIVLIPKVKNPRNITQYRPISLCNVIYKICSKVLANRLREILDEIIAEEQSAFVP